MRVIVLCVIYIISPGQILFPTHFFQTYEKTNQRLIEILLRSFFSFSKHKEHFTITPFY